MSKIIVLGGGISGLSAAFYLARSLAAKATPYEITLMDKGQLGGWVQSVDTGKGGAKCSAAGVSDQCQTTSLFQDAMKKFGEIYHL